MTAYQAAIVILQGAYNRATSTKGMMVLLHAMDYVRRKV